MTLLSTSRARRRSLRWPLHAIRLATVALLVAGIALAVSPAALAQMPDPEDLEAQIDAAVQQSVDAGGALAFVDEPPAGAPEPPPAPAPAVPPPAAPEPDPAADIDLTSPSHADTLSETAAPPAPESPSGPTNMNVDIRILSPGDNGDVTQVIELPVGPRPTRSAGP